MSRRTRTAACAHIATGSRTEPHCSTARVESELPVESELRGALGELNALVARHNLKVLLGLQISPLSLAHPRERS